MKTGTIVISLALLATSCNAPQSTDSAQKEIQVEETTATNGINSMDAEQIIQKAIEVHGGELYNTASYSFVFRKRTYTFENNNGEYVYTRTLHKRGKTIVDVVNNDTITRTVDGKPVELSEKKQKSYTNSINSVIYFATLPHKLKDTSVNKVDKGIATIKDQDYYVIEVNFNEEGGGDDHEDVYYYWVNQSTNYIDYFAYNYQINDGGVRFREAINQSTMDGIRFQDYVNFKAPVGTPLADLPALWENGQLEKMSLIANENLKNLNKQ